MQTPHDHFAGKTDPPGEANDICKNLCVRNSKIEKRAVSIVNTITSQDHEGKYTLHIHMALFVQTSRLTDAVTLMNSVSEKKLPLLLKRIVTKLSQKGQVFSDAEQEKLAKMLKLNQGELSTILEASSYMFEKALYDSAKVSKFQKSLEAVGLEAPGVAAFCTVWAEHAKKANDNAKANTIAGPRVLSSFAWRTDMHLAQSSTAKLKEQSAIFDFTTKGADGTKEEQFAVELSHDELYDLFVSLEKMQSQLDALGK